MITGLIIGTAVTLFGLLFIRIGLRQLHPDRSFEERGTKTRALCTAVRWRGFDTVDGDPTTLGYPTFRFRTADGRQIESESFLGRRPAAAREGLEYDVVYDPADPNRVQIVGGAGSVGTMLGAIFIMLGAVFALIGIAIALTLWKLFA